MPEAEAAGPDIHAGPDYESAVDVAEYRVLAQAGAQRVLETAGQRVLRGGEPAGKSSGRR
jgi:hypothetical protein